jgi:putative oxidoreductase
MLYHGYSKLKPGAPEQTAQFFGALGIKPPKQLGVATGIAEILVGVSALLGFGTRLAALAVLGTQAVAIQKVHAPKGFDFTKGGMEFNLALMAIATGLLLAGPGKVSTHEWLEHRLQRRTGLSRYLPRTRARRAVRLVKLLK